MINDDKERYSRQTILKGFGEAGQHKLSLAKVLVIGAGGLGCPALQYLTAAGIGCIGIADADVISLSNLHRQTLYTTSEIGLLKVDIATKKLNAVNPNIKIIKHQLNLNLIIETHDTNGFEANYLYTNLYTKTNDFTWF